MVGGGKLRAEMLEGGRGRSQHRDLTTLAAQPTEWRGHVNTTDSLAYCSRAAASGRLAQSLRSQRCRGRRQPSLWVAAGIWSAPHRRRAGWKRESLWHSRNGGVYIAGGK